MAAGDDEIEYVVRIEAIRVSIKELLARRIHPFFPAYLHLRQEATRQRTTTSISPTWAAVGDLLELPGGPIGRPHYRPFWNQTSRAGQAWLGPNLAGSYSPSSIRSTAPRLVLDTNPDGTYLLRDRHWELARENFADGLQLPLLTIASFLLRDYALISTAWPERSDLIESFLELFGYRRPNDDEEIEHLYDFEWGPEGEWFETLEEFEGARREMQDK